MTARKQLMRGLISGLLHEAVVVVLSLGAMVVLVRLLTPEEYGQAAAAIGVLAFIGAFRGAMFVEHALQHTKDHEPDWDTYFAVVGIVQIGLCGLTVAVSFVARAFDTFAALAPLLQVAALGFLLEWPAQIATVKLRRELRFERLKVLSSLAVLVRLASSVVLAWFGLGAMALIISGNVLGALPMTISFLLVERWRPRRWWSVPGAADVRPMLRFGGQQIAVGILQSLRTAAESLVVTRLFGAATLGLLNRARALYVSTIGRLGLVFVEAAYPLLPLEQADPKRYAHRASRYVEAALILSIPGAAFVVIEGAAISRLLYGSTWIEADPFLAPAAIAVAAGALVSVAADVVMGRGHVRTAVIAETIAAGGGLIALMAALLATSATPYVWALAATQVIAAILSFAFAAPFLERDWVRQGLYPTAAATTAGCAAVLGMRWAGLDGASGLIVSTITYGGLVAVVLAVTARPLVLEVLRTRNAFGWRTEQAAESQVQA